MRQERFSLSMGVWAAFVMIVASGLLRPGLLWAGRLQCPDSPEGVHQRDVLSTSAPEVKISQATRDNESRWSKAIRPLTLKATKLAKAQRAIAIEDGIEQSCPSNLVYVAQLVPVPDKPSGCDHRIVTRTGDNGVLYVQVIATCKYTWSCCSREESNKPSPVSYKLEGPMNPEPAKAPAAISASDVSPAPTVPAPSKPTKK